MQKIVTVSMVWAACGGLSESPGGTDAGKSFDANSDGSTSQLQMLFTSERTGNFEIWQSDLEGGNRIQLTDDPSLHSWWPRASRDGQTVLFYRSPASSDKDRSNYEQAALWRMKIDGSSQEEVIAHGDNGWNAQGVVDWSYDGTRLVMAANTDYWNIYVSNADLSGMQKVSQRSLFYVDPSFSPDGTRITYAAYPAGYEDVFNLAGLEIFTAKIDGSDEKRLTFDSIRDHDPYFSPDGVEIGFESDMNPSFQGPFPQPIGQWALRAAPAEGGPIREILNDGNINTLVEWMPDSQSLYFHRLTFEPLTGWRIAKINRDGTGLTIIDAGVEAGDAEPYIYKRAL